MKSEGSLRVLLQVWTVGIIAFFGLLGCQHGGGSGNPTAPELNLKEQGDRNTFSTLSEDTEGSAVDSTQYSQDAVVIVAIGDSITYGQGTWDGGYVSRLRSRLLAAGHNVVVLNKGIRGEQSAATDARFLKEIVEADIVLLMIGINDVINPGECATPFSCNVVGHITSMMDKALVSKVIPVISTITPARAGDEYDWANPQIQLINSEILPNSTGRGVVTVDNYQAIMSSGSAALYYDRLHFNAQGYNVLADQWFNAIEENGLIAEALAQKKKS
jgi:lysophospholipase L1-like esterase